MNMKNLKTDHEGGDNLSQAQSEYIELLEEKLIDQANEILRLKRKLNGIEAFKATKPIVTKFDEDGLEFTMIQDK